MAKKKANGQQPNDAALLEAAASLATVTEIHLEYVGPNYNLGIELPGSRDLIRPREFSFEQIADFTEKHPEYTEWWAPAGH